MQVIFRKVDDERYLIGLRRDARYDVGTGVPRGSARAAVRPPRPRHCRSDGN